VEILVAAVDAGDEVGGGDVGFAQRAQDMQPADLRCDPRIEAQPVGWVEFFTRPNN